MISTDIDTASYFLSATSSSSPVPMAEKAGAKSCLPLGHDGTGKAVDGSKHVETVEEMSLMRKYAIVQ